MSRPVYASKMRLVQGRDVCDCSCGPVSSDIIVRMTNEKDICNEPKYDERVASTYDAVRERERHWWYEDEFIRQFFLKHKVKSLLDLPVGTGRFFRHYQGVENLTGVDISEHMLTEARRRVGQLSPAATVTLETGDVFALKYPDRFFDVTIVWRLFHLLPPDVLPGAVKELCRVTRGELIVQAYTPPHKRDRFWNRLRLKLGLRRLPQYLLASPQIPKHDPQNAKAWSHIPAYWHPQELFDKLFANEGCKRKGARFLDEYEHCDVRVAIYQKVR